MKIHENGDGKGIGSKLLHDVDDGVGVESERVHHFSVVGLEECETCGGEVLGARLAGVFLLEANSAKERKKSGGKKKVSSLNPDRDGAEVKTYW